MAYVNKLPPIQTTKLIPRNFGSIKHITGSKMLNKTDSRADEAIQNWCLDKTRKPSDIVLISEKIDGMNAGAFKSLTGEIYPITRAGYDARTLGTKVAELRLLGLVWTMWVNDHYDLLDRLLQPGERMVFENAMLTHSLRYRFDKSPVFLLAKYNVQNVRMIHEDLLKIEDAGNGQWRIPQVLWEGGAISAAEALRLVSATGTESLDGPEGVVYKYESDGQHVTSIKYVSNPLLEIDSKGVMPLEYNKFNTQYFDCSRVTEAAEALGLTKFWQCIDEVE